MAKTDEVRESFADLAATNLIELALAQRGFRGRWLQRYSRGKAIKTDRFYKFRLVIEYTHDQCSSNSAKVEASCLIATLNGEWAWAKSVELKVQTTDQGVIDQYGFTGELMQGRGFVLTPQIRVNMKELSNGSYRAYPIASRTGYPVSEKDGWDFTALGWRSAIDGWMTSHAKRFGFFDFKDVSKATDVLR